MVEPWMNGFMNSEEKYIVGQKMISPALSSDRNIAAFFIHLGDYNEYKPHFHKAARASLGYALQINALQSSIVSKSECTRTINFTFNF